MNTQHLPEEVDNLLTEEQKNVLSHDRSTYDMVAVEVMYNILGEPLQCVVVPAAKVRFNKSKEKAYIIGNDSIVEFTAPVPGSKKSNLYVVAHGFNRTEILRYQPA